MLAFVLIIGAMGQFIIWHRILWEMVPSGDTQRLERCTRCGYDLRGLPVDPVCPECGLQSLPIPVGMVPKFRRDRAVLMPLVILASLLIVAIPPGVTHVMLAMEIRLMGYSWAVADTYATVHTGTEFTEKHPIVLIYAIALAPLVTLVRNRRLAAGALVGAMAVYVVLLVMVRL